MLPIESIPGKAFTVNHFRKWSRKFKLKDGRRFELEEFQAWFLKDLFARTDGRPTYAELWLIIPEGNGKTTFISLVVLYYIEFVDEAWVPVAASSRDQGVDLTYRIASGFVKRNDLEGVFRLHPGYRQVVHNGSLGTAKIFASDAASGDGVDPTLALIEELHRLTSMELYETWSGKLDKSDGQLVVVSTAGPPGSPFEELRERIRGLGTAKQSGRFTRIEAEGLVMHEYALAEKDDPLNFALVKQANPLSAITPERLARKQRKPTWRLGHWKRFTCNIPTETDHDLFIEGADWNACGGGPEIEDGDIAIGADGSRTWDTTVVAWARRDGDFIDVACKVFSVRPEAPHHILHQGGKIDFDDVETFLVDLFDRFEPVATAYDPRYLERSMEIVDVRLPEAAIIAVEPQTKAARDAYQAFYTAVVDKKLRHRGDPVIAAHLANCAVDRDERTNEIRRLRKIDARKPIDAVPALSLAVWGVQQGAPETFLVVAA